MTYNDDEEDRLYGENDEEQPPPKQIFPWVPQCGAGKHDNGRSQANGDGQ